jgi:outer membrane lipoprotein-sorting protein
MGKFRAVSGWVGLALIVALLIPLVSCAGGRTTVMPTPSTVPTSNAASTSGKTLADIYGVGKNIGDVKFDMVITSAGVPQPMIQAYWKDPWLLNSMKFRYEMSTEGSTSIYLVDFGTQTAYMWLKEQNIAYRIDMSQAPRNPAESSDQIYPTYVDTETVDNKLCDVYQYTGPDGSTKVWVWKDKSFPIRMESTTSSGTTIEECSNIVFGTLSDDLFQLPAGVQIIESPMLTPQP